MIKTRQLITIIVIVSLLTGWMLIRHHHKHLNDLQDYVLQLKQTAAKLHAVNKAVSIQQPSPVYYNAASLPSPFGEVALTNQSELHVQAGNPLLSYPINMLRFVGTLSQGNTTFAFVVAPDNMVYQVGLGDSIGIHQGKVVDIQSQQLDVMEQDLENGKSLNEHLVTIQLKD